VVAGQTINQINRQDIQSISKSDYPMVVIPKSLQMVTAAMKLRHLLLRRKAMTNLDSILKSRDTTLSTKVHLVKTMVYPVVMYG